MSAALSALSFAGLAFVAGLVSVASPCVLPLVPAYLGVVGSTFEKEPASSAQIFQARMLFIVGFGAVFVALGVFAGALASLVPPPSQLRLAGLVLFAVGLAGVGLLPEVGLLRVVGRVTVGRLSPFGLGAVFALAATPCASTLLGVTLASAAVGATAISGGATLACYGTGIAVGVVCVDTGTSKAASLFRGLNPYHAAASILAASLTIAVGATLAFGEGWRLNVAAARLIELFGQVV